MASVSFDVFLPEVMLEVDGVPSPVAINAIRNACFDFCRDSLYWNEVQDAEPYVANTASYELSAPSGAQIIAVRDCVLDNKKTVYPWPLDEVKAAMPSWQARTGQIEGFVTLEPNTITFIAVPDSAGTFAATVVLAPTRTATTTDAKLYNMHLETIKYGALWKLKSQVGKPWTDPAGAKENESLFLMGVNAATVDRQRTNSSAVSRAAPRAFV